MDKRLLDVLACPVCKGPLDHTGAELRCRACRVAYPIRDDIPIMLEDEAREFSSEELGG